MNTVAWAAGLFEGEGSIVSFGPRKQQRSLTLAMTDADVVGAFAKTIGVGKVYGPYQYTGTDARKREHHKPYLRWSVGDAQGVLSALDKMLPFMGARRTAKMLDARAAVLLLAPRKTRGVAWTNTPAKLIS